MKKTTIYFIVFMVFAITMWVLSNDRFEYPFAPTTPVAVNVDQITSGLHTAGADTILETGCDQKITWKQVKGKSCSGRSVTWQKPIVTVRDPHLTVIRKEGATLTADSLLRLVDEAGGTIVPKASDTSTSWTTWPVYDWIANLLRIILVVFIISFLIWLLGWLVQFVRNAWTNWNNQPAPVAPVAVQNQQSQPQPQAQSQNNYFGGLDSAINLAVQNGRSVELTLKIGGSNNPSPNNITPNPSNTDNSDMD